MVHTLTDCSYKLYPNYHIPCGAGTGKGCCCSTFLQATSLSPAMSLHFAGSIEVAATSLSPDSYQGEISPLYAPVVNCYRVLAALQACPFVEQSCCLPKALVAHQQLLWRSCSPETQQPLLQTPFAAGQEHRVQTHHLSHQDKIRGTAAKGNGKDCTQPLQEPRVSCRVVSCS